MSHNSAILSIEDIKQYHFLVEDYQRGYKWTKIEVEQLLKDINDFEGESFYCLQPVVVKRVDEDKIELIDGQQRITTIYIIFSYLEQNKYTIDYKTRTSSTDFLQNIGELSQSKGDWNKYIESHKNHDNIDNYHFFTAYHIIKDWFKGKNENFINVFLEKLNDKVKVIWYEVKSIDERLSKQESIKIFTRINSGKIRLTNAELIKALFLINIEEGKNADLLQLKQNEIAQQWDTIEYALQNDAFWYFLSNEEPIATRIEFIFDLIKEKPKDTEEELYTFLKYNQDFQENANKIAWVESKWEEVHKTFLTLQEWYEDPKLYHLIGFLVCTKITTISRLYKEYKENQAILSKQGWIAHIEDKIKKKVSNYDLDVLKFSENKDKPKINHILLLYNIETELKNTDSNRKYPFDNHKGETWSLEHIHAQNEPTLDDESAIFSYLNDFMIYIEDIKDMNGENKKQLLDLKDELAEKKPFDKSLFQLFKDKAKELFPDLFDLHTIDNMALLSSKLNSSLSNGFFNEKRAKIIEFDKAGKFIPICTRNVFLKYYSKDNTTNLFYWSSEDRKDYLEDIKNTLKNYIPKKPKPQ